MKHIKKFNENIVGSVNDRDEIIDIYAKICELSEKLEWFNRIKTEDVEPDDVVKFESIVSELKNFNTDDIDQMAEKLFVFLYSKESYGDLPIEDS